MIKKIRLLAIIGGAVVFAACAPNSEVIKSGTSELNSRLSYTIAKYEEPYVIGDITATHVMEYNTVQVSVDTDRTRWIGIPDEVWDEYGTIIQETCKSERKSYRAYEYRSDVQSRKAEIYFVCA